MGLLDSLFGSSKQPKQPPAPKAPKGMKEAANRQADIGEDYLSFAKEQFQVSQERQAKLDAQTEKTNQFLMSIGEEDRARFKEVFEPLQDQIIAEARGYDSPERLAEASAKAQADVQSAAARERGAMERQQFSMGVSPDSGRYGGLDRAYGLGTALGSVDAANKSTEMLRNRAQELRFGAASMGQNLTGQAMAAGQMAQNNTLAANQQWLQTPGIVAEGARLGMAGQAGKAASLGGIYNTQAGIYGTQGGMYGVDSKVAAANAEGTGNFLGTVAGAAIPLMFSDKKAKKDRKKVKEGEALEAVEQTPIESYRYKDGVMDGGAEAHVGPMAQDVEKVAGIGDGKAIPMQDLLGLTMGAVKDLSAKVDQIAEVVGLGAQPATARA